MNTFHLKKKSFFFIFLLILFTEAANHKFYVSTSIAEFLKEKKSIQVISQIFIDDLENVLKLNYEGDLKLYPDTDPILVDSLISNYVDNHLKFIENGNVLKNSFVGREYKNDVLVCYTEVFFDSIPQSFQVRNTILFDFISEQKNIFHFQYGKVRKSYLFYSDKNTYVINLN
tara:strand:- start:228 stop:743 length:516 start_codon:yes stop_codon:yes gene_type:complete